MLMGHGRNGLRRAQSCPVSGIRHAGVRPCEWGNTMSDPVKRAERWKAKYNVERVKDTLNDIREDMGKRYEAAIVIVHDGREVLVQVWPYVQAYRIVVSAKMFLFRASVPSTSLRAGPEAAGVIVSRTKGEVRLFVISTFPFALVLCRGVF